MKAGDARKSGEGSLHKRGLAGPEELELVAGREEKDLMELLNGRIPALRTAAVVQLSETSAESPAFIAALLKLLTREKSLYTRLAICDALAQGGENAARQMVCYLGTIGNNQHRTLPGQVSQKKSYPLPRDIIARTLGKMPASIFPVLEEVLQGGDTGKISEALDAVGFMVFYQPSLATAENAGVVCNVMNRFPDNQLIQWKAVLCLSAFPLEESERRLESFLSLESLLGEEARRSLKMIHRHR